MTMFYAIIKLQISEEDIILKEYAADLSAMKLLQIAVCLLAAILIAACVWLLSRWTIVMWIVISILIVAAFVFSFLWMPMYFARLECIVTSNQITIRTGILLQREQSIRLQSVQYVQLITGPFDGMLGLNFILLYVYGGSMMIFFLSQQSRKELVDFLQRKGVFHVP